MINALQHLVPYVGLLSDLHQGLYQFLSSPGSYFSTLRHSSPVSLDYSTFGATTNSPILPDNLDAARWVIDALFALTHHYICTLDLPLCITTSSSPPSAPKSYLQFVGGKTCKAVSGCSLAVQSPGGGVLAHCPDGGRKDVRNAVEAAFKVQPGWEPRKQTFELSRGNNKTHICDFFFFN